VRDSNRRASAQPEAMCSSFIPSPNEAATDICPISPADQAAPDSERPSTTWASASPVPIGTTNALG
jgi:hypothetical protein